ncbi:MAG: hypothetical protein JW936_00835 [Sedimentisphaerales bacterium]|nr:hypothetical protein [Sedimentisphaerales bacterium]
MRRLMVMSLVVFLSGVVFGDAEDGRVDLSWGITEGSRAEVRQNGSFTFVGEMMMEGADEAVARDSELRIMSEFVESYVSVDEGTGKPLEISRAYGGVDVLVRDNLEDVTHERSLPVEGLVARIEVDPATDDFTLMNGDDLPNGLARMIEEDSWSDLLPGRVIAVGESWEIEGEQLDRVLAGADATGGSVRMELVDIWPGGEALCRGEVTLEDMDLGPMGKFDFRGEIEIIFSTEAGLVTSTELMGTMTTDDDVEMGDGTRCHMAGWGEMNWSERVEMLDENEAGAAEVTEVGLSGAAIELGGGNRVRNGRPGLSARVGGGRNNGGVGELSPENVEYVSYTEENEGAFTMEIPRGWVTEGGIVRMMPDEGGPANAIAAKLNFAVASDRNGTVMLHNIPEFYFIDMTGSPARQMGLFPEGSVNNGVLVCAEMSATDFLRDLVIPEIHDDVRGLRIMEERRLPDLARAYYEGTVRAIPALSFLSFDAGIVVIRYRENGVLYEELMYTALQMMGQTGAGLWQNKDTFTCRAPVGQLEAWGPVFEHMRNSVEINEDWLERETDGQMQRMDVWRETTRDINQICEDVAQHRRETNERISEQMSEVLRGDGDND